MGEQTPNTTPAEIALGFTSNYTVKLDSAQRAAFPAKFREVLDRKYGDSASQVVLIPDSGKLKVLPMPVWQKMQERLNNLPDFDPSSDDLRTLIFGNMVICPLDGQNRIRLTPMLCELADLKKEVVFVGQQDRMEIWDTEKWREFTTQTTKNLRSVMTEVFRNSRSGA